MIVIADTSPISYLILIGEVDILSKLDGKVSIPRGVFDELTSTKAPFEVREWLGKQPEWLVTVDLNGEVDEGIARLLDKGESEAIQLARNIHADLVIIDEVKGRKVALEYGLEVIGLIGVLISASQRGLIDKELVISKLQNTKFFVTKRLIDLLRNA